MISQMQSVGGSVHFSHKHVRVCLITINILSINEENDMKFQNIPILTEEGTLLSMHR